MKTRSRVLIMLTVVIVGFFIIPQTITNVCNTLEIYDERCPRIGGIQTPFGGQIQIWNTIPPVPVDSSVNNTNTLNDFFMDNVTRSSVIHVGSGHSVTNGLKVNMTQSLTITGNVHYVPLWIFGVDWNSSSHDVLIETLEDENHNKILLPINEGTFQQLIKIPKYYCGGFMSYHSLGTIQIHEGIPREISVKYTLPDILPSDGIYHMNFSSPYPVKVEIPGNFEITHNDTKICPVSYTRPHPNVFFYDFSFKMR